MTASEPHPASGCPFSGRADEFDPFGPDYQADPATALAWAREEQPVFYAPRLGYWVVTRYEDVKAVFRDPILFSPRIALEKITPVSQEAQDVLASYGYAMNRTLVNEDEPAHMERRRVLMEHFIPENLARREESIQRLTREKVDAFIDRGRADLVDEMFWEIPLTVALDFLGVPEEDMEKLRQFSVAHTVNTWGRPTAEQQVEVAHAVGQFWQFAGEVLDRMRQNPDGPGWMHYAIRKNAVMPEIVTDSYLHSMMMAIIVAAHETTALGSANAMRALLTDRPTWDRLCHDPTLIPNAVEECLRAVGSVVAWRRQAMAQTEIGGIEIPMGAKLLLMQASANRDPRHFENGETLDIWRDNAVDHLTFGYGVHQCMGKNIARMEIRIFVEELARRLPHMRLVEQEFTFLPNTSFRGPEHLWVEWDAEQNPERRDLALRESGRSFPIGAPLRRDIARAVRVADIRKEAEGVLGVVLEDPVGRLPDWSAGAHVEVELDGTSRFYSLCGPVGDGRVTIAILREEAGRGGSRLFHERLAPGMELKLRGPRNHFRLDEEAARHVLIAGGIGITPIIAMADRLKALGRNYELHYAGRSRRTMAFLDRIAKDHGQRTMLYPADEGQRADLLALVARRGENGQICACGPDRMIKALEALTADLAPGAFAFEHFTGGDVALDPAKEQGFDVELTDSELRLHVPPDRTLLSVLRSAGIDLPSDCEEGLCGTCECAVVAGEIDHRDKVLSNVERAKGDRMMTCCSRAKDGTPLKIAL